MFNLIFQIAVNSSFHLCTSTNPLFSLFCYSSYQTISDVSNTVQYIGLMGNGSTSGIKAMSRSTKPQTSTSTLTLNDIIKACIIRNNRNNVYTSISSRISSMVNCLEYSIVIIEEFNELRNLLSNCEPCINILKIIITADIVSKYYNVSLQTVYSNITQCNPIFIQNENNINYYNLSCGTTDYNVQYNLTYQTYQIKCNNGFIASVQVKNNPISYTITLLGGPLKGKSFTIN